MIVAEFREPHHAVMFGRVTRALHGMAAEGKLPTGDVDEAGRAGPEFVGELTRAIIAVDREDAAKIDGRPTTAVAWGELAARPAKGHRRERALLKIGGKLMQGDAPDLDLMVLQLLESWNRTHCLPPLQPFEVELLWQYLCKRHSPQVSA